MLGHRAWCCLEIRCYNHVKKWKPYWKITIAPKVLASKGGFLLPSIHSKYKSFGTGSRRCKLSESIFGSKTVSPSLLSEKDIFPLLWHEVKFLLLSCPLYSSPFCIYFTLLLPIFPFFLFLLHFSSVSLPAFHNCSPDGNSWYPPFCGGILQKRPLISFDFFLLWYYDSVARQR